MQLATNERRRSILFFLYKKLENFYFRIVRFNVFSLNITSLNYERLNWKLFNEKKTLVILVIFTNVYEEKRSFWKDLCDLFFVVVKFNLDFVCQFGKYSALLGLFATVLRWDWWVFLFLSHFTCWLVTQTIRSGKKYSDYKLLCVTWTLVCLWNVDHIF